MLDDMANHFNEKEFDREFLGKLNECMAKDDDDLLAKSQEAAWAGMIEYWKSNGTEVDFYGQHDFWGNRKPTVMRQTPALFGEQKMTIFEPCNYASNVAYYHSTTRICDYPDWKSDIRHQVAIKRNFATLAMGSAFWHGSHTTVGNRFDNNMIAVIAYVAH